MQFFLEGENCCKTRLAYCVLVESFDPIIAVINGRAREHVICVQSIPKNIKSSLRADDEVNALNNETS